jgi:hypothetical protein
MFEITQEEVKRTVEHPDKMMDCQIDGMCFFVRKIKGKTELLVMAEKTEGTNYEVKCFGWLQPMFYPS